MTEKPKLDMDRIAKALGAERCGQVEAKGGYFGALELVAEVRERFVTPPGGGRATDPAWTERRLVPLTPETLEKLERLARDLSESRGVAVTPLQLAALLLQRATMQMVEAPAGGSSRPR